MNRVRIEQLLRGAVGADLMLLQLRLKEKKLTHLLFLSCLVRLGLRKNMNDHGVKFMRELGALEHRIVSLQLQ